MRKSALFFFGLVVTALVALGLVVLSSASEANATRLHGDNLFFMKRQFIYLAGGVLVAVCTALFDYRRWRENWILTALFYGVVFVLLLLVFNYPAINGSRRWIDLGFLRLQPSEFAKLVTVVAVAVWLDKAGWRVELFKRGAMMSSVLIGALTLPILLEPDFGSVMVVASAGALMMLVAGVRILHIVPFAAVGLGVLVYKVATNANRMARIAAFVGVTAGGAPEATTSDAGAAPGGAKVVLSAEDEATKRADYQANQALVAIHNGGVWGVGLRESMQKQLYLPEAHTDFVFAIGAEELGVFFSAAVITLFSLFFGLAVYISRKASDRLGRFLALGMSFLIYFQAMFNLGVVCKALPTKGMALPFFSYGGTNLLSAFFAVGTILSVGIHSYRDRKRRVPNKVLMRS